MAENTRFVVFVDGQLQASVPTNGLSLLAIGIRGSVLEEELAILDVSGGSYPEESQSTHQVWIDDLIIQTGQIVKIAILNLAQENSKAYSLEELYPNAELDQSFDFKLTDQMLATLQAKPKFRDAYTFCYRSSLGTQFTGKSQPDASGFGFSVLWNSYHHPDTARITLHCYSLADLENKSPGNRLVLERIGIGDFVEFQAFDSNESLISPDKFLR